MHQNVSGMNRQCWNLKIPHCGWFRPSTAMLEMLSHSQSAINATDSKTNNFRQPVSVLCRFKRSHHSSGVPTQNILSYLALTAWNLIYRLSGWRNPASINTVCQKVHSSCEARSRYLFQCSTVYTRGMPLLDEVPKGFKWRFITFPVI